MELKINIGFDQVINIIKQLPANQIEKIKLELSSDYISDKATREISKFQKFLLSGPVMSDEQYEAFKEYREKINQWRTK